MSPSLPLRLAEKPTELGRSRNQIDFLAFIPPSFETAARKWFSRSFTLAGQFRGYNGRRMCRYVKRCGLTAVRPGVSTAMIVPAMGA